ncbi:hypothetical protein [Bacillus anthracis]
MVPAFATDCSDADNCVPFRYKAKARSSPAASEFAFEFQIA